jgi:LysM repeat protein
MPQIDAHLPHYRRFPYLLFLTAILLFFGLSIPGAPAYAQEQVHVVQYGENLASVAQEYDIKLDELMSINGITNPDVIYVGQRLLIPGNPETGEYGTPAQNESLPGSDGYYVVRRGDTLSQIAQRHGMALSDAMRLNNITDPGTIYVGQRLRVTARVTPLPAELPAQPQVADYIYVVQTGDTLYSLARQFETTPQALMSANGLPNANFVYIGQRLRIRSGVQEPGAVLIAAGAPPDGKRWIEVNLTNQTLTAWQGDLAVLHTNISSGTDWFPTVTGRYQIQRKYEKQRMTGPDYDLPNVPWVMYFYSGYAIHGAYWHARFGTPTSHGCINMRVEEAEAIYHWADFGTEVYVHY